jgi:hypothetical protein
VLEGLYEQLKRGHDLSQGDVEGAIRQAIAQGSLFDYDPAAPRPRSRKSICASARCVHAPRHRTLIFVR